MNFLNAHKIVHDYAGSVGMGADKNAIGRPISYLKNTKDEIVNAYKIFYAHMIFFHTRTQDEYDQYQTVYRFINDFIDMDKYNETIECNKIVNNKSIFGKFQNKEKVNNAREKLNGFMQEYADKLLHPYRIEEIDDIFPKLQNKSQELHNYIKEEMEKNGEDSASKIYYSCCEEYCKFAYNLVGIELSETDLPFFMSFDTMRKFLEDKDLSTYYVGYENYVKNNR
jgi:hypothetical protein